MKRFLVTLLMVCFCWLLSMAQDGYAIKGAVVDTASSIKLAKSSIVLVHAKDSMLYTFTRADASGNFQLEGLDTGEYILFATFPEYADYVERFTLDSANKVMDFGNLGLVLRAKLLEEVLVNRRQAITIRGDTTEYDAASFTIQPNSKVEDLLQQLPGIQVDQDGKITAQGQTVNKVLVDGEEFFGDDPTLVTRNLRGDMVDKVQLYDKRSDQAEFTGVDDGERSKTLNIVLKDDKKKGHFGKIDAGVGSKDFYQGQAMFNRFNDKQRFSAFGTIGNTGQTGLSWQDADRYAPSGNTTLMEDGGIMIMMTGGQDDIESWGGRYDGRGIPSALNGGAFYSNKWNDGKQSINGNYKIGELSVEGVNNTITQNNLPTGTINTVSGQTFDRRIFRQRGGAIFETQFDSTSTLKVTVDGTLRNGETTEFNQSSGTDGAGDMLNQSIRRTTNDTEGVSAYLTALWTKKLRKQGRTLSWELNETIEQSNANGFLYSENTFYERGAVDSIWIVDQHKINDNNSSVFNSNVTYSEPFSPALALVLNYRLTASNGTSLRQSFNPAGVGNYTDLDSLFSNDFKLNQLSNQLGAIFNFKKGKSTVNFGTRVSRVQFDQTDRYADSRFERSFTNHNPQVRWQYRFSQQKSFTLSYNGNNTQPNINQIQPVRVNDDPMNIVLGNPDLKPSYTNRFNVSYNSFKVIGNQYVYFSGSFSNTNNPIVSNTYTDSVGRSTFQYANLDDESPFNYYFYSNFSKNLKKWNVNVGAGLNTNGNIYYNLTNGELNKTQSSTYGGSINIRQYIQKKYDFFVNFGPTYTYGQSSLQRQQNNNGWGLNGNYSFNIYLPLKFQITSDGQYTYTAATQSFDEEFERFIVNASVSKKFLKDETLRFSVGVNDLLNQNVGFSRSASNNILSQNSYTTITRYLMFSLTWDFNRMGGVSIQN
ncbi:outer membrane beta-barrel family protein [Parapedobacter koreensis]|uniref:Outer membrane receptor proteins, mostly Fe transport n=1 Tax=Parapedobacter koreensis TaxID=332977 RepID=A0A1H7J7R0_9SPHI|nr:outer membrane beta-barrel family protein [Parapedobacter koreensis]SEK69215.1 Outer membrane receptor proteins, mostly Fe transport [Parapedobacter koreensis]